MEIDQDHAEHQSESENHQKLYINYRDKNDLYDMMSENAGVEIGNHLINEVTGSIIEKHY